MSIFKKREPWKGTKAEKHIKNIRNADFFEKEDVL